MNTPIPARWEYYPELVDFCLACKDECQEQHTGFFVLYSAHDVPMVALCKGCATKLGYLYGDVAETEMADGTDSPATQETWEPNGMLDRQLENIMKDF